MPGWQDWSPGIVSGLGSGAESLFRQPSPPPGGTWGNIGSVLGGVFGRGGGGRNIFGETPIFNNVVEAPRMRGFSNLFAPEPEPIRRGGGFQPRFSTPSINQNFDMSGLFREPSRGFDFSRAAEGAAPTRQTRPWESFSPRITSGLGGDTEPSVPALGERRRPGFAESLAQMRAGGPAYKAYQESVGKQPTRAQHKPGFWATLGSLAAAGGTGYLTGDIGKGIQVGEALSNIGYKRAMSEWEAKHKPLAAAAKEEREQMKQMVDIQEAVQRGELSQAQGEKIYDDIARERAEFPLKQQQAAATLNKTQAETQKIIRDLNNPELTHHRTNKGELIFTNPRTGKVVTRYEHVDVPEPQLIGLRTLGQQAVAGTEAAYAAGRQASQQQFEAGQLERRIAAGQYRRNPPAQTDRERDSRIRALLVDAAKSNDPKGRMAAEVFPRDENDPGRTTIDQKAVRKYNLTPTQVDELWRDVEAAAQIYPERE